VPVGLAIAGANRHAMQRSKPTLESIPVARPTPTTDVPQAMCMDRGYDYDEVRHSLEECGFTAHIRARGEEAQALKQEAGLRARWWVGERTRRWMNGFRRILILWDKKICELFGSVAFRVRLDRIQSV
jgi:putative transposase